MIVFMYFVCFVYVYFAKKMTKWISDLNILKYTHISVSLRNHNLMGFFFCFLYMNVFMQQEGSVLFSVEYF